jgi:hypothetical protein
LWIKALVWLFVAGQDVAADVEQCDSGVVHRDVEAAEDVASGVQVHRDVWATHHFRPRDLGELAQESELGQFGAVAGDQGGGEPGSSGDRAARYRPAGFDPLWIFARRGTGTGAVHVFPSRAAPAR